MAGEEEASLRFGWFKSKAVINPDGVVRVFRTGFEATPDLMDSIRNEGDERALKCGLASLRIELFGRHARASLCDRYPHEVALGSSIPAPCGHRTRGIDS